MKTQLIKKNTHLESISLQELLSQYSDEQIQSAIEILEEKHSKTKIVKSKAPLNQKEFTYHNICITCGNAWDSVTVLYFKEKPFPNTFTLKHKLCSQCYRFLRSKTQEELIALLVNELSK